MKSLKDQQGDMRLAVVEQNGTGGMIHYAYQLCTALAEAGAKVTLITERGYELREYPHNFEVDSRLHLWPLIDPRSIQPPPSNLLGRLWRRITWTIRRGVRALRLVRMWMGLINHLLVTRPDLVQFGKINFPFEALFLARLRRGGLVLTQINHEFERRESRGLLAGQIDKMYASTYRNFSAIFFHAEENRDRFLSLFDVPRELTHIIPMGNQEFLRKLASRKGVEANLRDKYGLKEGEPVVVFFGVIAPSKGLPDLIDAFSLVEKQSAAKLVVAGYPTKFVNINDIRDHIDRLGLSNRVILDTRYISNEEIAGLMELATVVALPYHSSTQSGALQVAYIFGRPVVTTMVGGLPDVVEEGKSGFLVPPRSPQALAERILSLVRDPALAARMGEHARHLAETRYSWGPIGKRVLKVYEGLLEG